MPYTFNGNPRPFPLGPVYRRRSVVMGVPWYPAWLGRRPAFEPNTETTEQTQARFSAAIQERLDAFARTRLYTTSCRLHLHGSTTEIRAEGNAASNCGTILGLPPQHPQRRSDRQPSCDDRYRLCRTAGPDLAGLSRTGVSPTAAPPLPPNPIEALLLPDPFPCCEMRRSIAVCTIGRPELELRS